MLWESVFTCNEQSGISVQYLIFDSGERLSSAFIGFAENEPFLREVQEGIVQSY